jgi:hypothetical protein
LPTTSAMRFSALQSATESNNSNIERGNFKNMSAPQAMMTPFSSGQD